MGKYIILTLFLLLILVDKNLAQQGQMFSCAGKILDHTSAEPLIGATLYNMRSAEGVTSDNFGNFFLSAVSDSDTVVIQYIGYQSLYLTGRELVQKPLVIALDNNLILDTVAVTATNIDKSYGRSIGITDLPIQQIKQMPALLGEADPLKALSYTAGISGGMEGATGLFVRGSSPDQNLILLDDAVIYNGAHFLGFLSSFNIDVVKKVRMYKSNMPVTFGGRLSSVLDIRTKNGNKQSKSLLFSISPVTSKLMLELPLQKNKTSLLLASRGSFLDLVTLPLYIKFKQGKRSEYLGYQMYDLNAKVHHIFSDQQQMSISYFKTHDNFRRLSTSEVVNNFMAKDKLTYGNQALNLKLVSTINDRIVANTSMVWSDYFSRQNSIGASGDAVFSNGKAASRIQNVGLRSDWKYWMAQRHELLFGTSLEWETFDPSRLHLTSPDGTALEDADLWGDNSKDTRSIALYAGYRYFFAQHWSINAGVRAWQFHNGEYEKVMLEPRISIALDLGKNGSVRAVYSRSYQGIHFLTNNGLSLPTDFWLPAIENIPIANSSQWSLGYQKNWPSGITVETDAYFKKMNNLITLKDGIDYYQPNQAIEQKLETQGKGNAYGWEISLTKNTGKFTGRVAYTYSRSWRKFGNINNGERFRFKYDRPHDFSFFGVLKLKRRWSLASTFVYSSGIVQTRPVAAYYTTPLDFNLVLHFDGRNNSRLKDYVRLDVGATKKFKRSELTFSIYNVLGRANPIYREFSQDFSINGKAFLKSNAVALFPFIPSVSYAIKIF